MNPVPHAVTLSGSNSEMFRGFLAVTIDGAGQRVGSFAAAANSQTTCTVSMHIVFQSQGHRVGVNGQSVPQGSNLPVTTCLITAIIVQSFFFPLIKWT